MGFWRPALPNVRVRSHKMGKTRGRGSKRNLGGDRDGVALVLIRFVSRPFCSLGGVATRPDRTDMCRKTGTYIHVDM
jgi:hypothetical protein